MNTLEKLSVLQTVRSLKQSLATFLDQPFDTPVNRETLTAEVARVCSTFVDRSLLSDFSIKSFGKPTGTTLVRDTGPRPPYKKVHYAVMHYDSGETDVVKVKGTYRRAKKRLRAHLSNRDKYLCSVRLQPAAPIEFIKYDIKVGPTTEA